MKKKLNLKIEEVKINKNLQSKGMYGGACGGACGGGAPCASSVDSGGPTSNGFGGTAAGGSVGEGGGLHCGDRMINAAAEIAKSAAEGFLATGNRMGAIEGALQTGFDELDSCLDCHFR